MDINSIKHQINYLVDLSFQMEYNFDLNQARKIYREMDKLLKLIILLQERLNTTKAYTNINLYSYEEDLITSYNFLSYVTRYKVKTKVGYKMFIKDIISYNLILK